MTPADTPPRGRGNVVDTSPRGRSKFAVLREILTLDVEREHQRIAFLSGCYDFPFDTQRALELALLRTFAVPRSSALLVRTGEFVERTQKRYDDTTILISTLGFHGYDSEPGRRALRRMNQIHQRYSIDNDEMRYVLSTFVLEPIRWNARFGWRPLSGREKEASYVFWREVGKRMGIRDLPGDLAAMERESLAYEREHFAFSDDNRRLFETTRELLLGWWLPPRLRPFGRPLVDALLDEPLRRAFGLSDPPAIAGATVEAALWLRKNALRLLPPRREPYRLPPTRSYPLGYHLEEIGPGEDRSPRP